MLFKKSHNMHMFFPLICCTSEPMSSLRHGIQYRQYHNGIMQVLRLGIMIMFELCHHRETTSHSQPSIRGCMTSWSTGVGGGPHLTAAHSARPDMCGERTYHTNSCQTSRVDFFVSFFLHRVSNSGRKSTARLFTQTGNECRRRCQLPQRETVNR